MRLFRPQIVAPIALSFLFLASEAAAKLPFIEDDYSRAIAEARARNVPIFLEAWAPW
jgi:hypothetical protein